MAFGGGTWTVQNKVMPGAYINIVNASTVGAVLGERGTVAIALALNKAPGTVIEIERAEFVKDAAALTGKEYASAELAPLREIFCNATKVYVYDMGEGNSAADAIAALEPYEFNVLCAYAEDTAAYVAAVKSWRDDYGKKCQVVIYNAGETGSDYEGVIDVASTVTTEGAPAYALTAWVAGAEAGCAINKTCTNMIYNGEYAVATNKTQADLENCLTGGKFVFHLAYGDVRVLEDINSLVTTTEDKGEDFKYNQTIRVIDQIANDIAKLFNTKYLGKIPNNASGRMSLRSEIISHHRQLEEVQAIENFDTALLTVEQGNNKRSVVVNDAVSVTNAMSILYMTVEIN